MIIKFVDDSKLYNLECDITDQYVILSNGQDDLGEHNTGFYVLDENDKTTVLYDYSDYVVSSKTESTITYVKEKFIYFRYNPETMFATAISVTTDKSVENAVLFRSMLGVDEMYPFSIELFNENGLPKYKIVDGKIVELTDDELNQIAYARNYGIYFIYDEDKYVNDIVLVKHTAEIPNNAIFYSDIDYEKIGNFEELKLEIPIFDIDGFFLYKEENGKFVSTTDDDKKAYLDKKNKALIEKLKEDKIKESKSLLALYLETHPLKSDCHGGVDAFYNVTTEKQALMSSNYLTYTVSKASGLDAKLTWNASGQECEEWTEQEYVTLILQISEYVKPLVSLQQSYEVDIKKCTSVEELNAIEISYDIY